MRALRQTSRRRDLFAVASHLQTSGSPGGAGLSAPATDRLANLKGCHVQRGRAEGARHGATCSTEGHPQLQLPFSLNLLPFHSLPRYVEMRLEQGAVLEGHLVLAAPALLKGIPN